MSKKTKQKIKPTTIEAEHKSYPKAINKRFHQLRFNMEDNKVDSVFIQNLPSIRYLTNYSGSAGALLVTEDEIHFFTDDRYEEQVKTELFDLHNLNIHITRDVWGYIKENGLLNKINTLAIESDNLSFLEGKSICSKLRSAKATCKPLPSLVERYTQPKSPEEIESIKKSCAISEKVFEHILTFIKPGITEIDIAIEIDHKSRLLGSEGPAFDTIVTSGSRGALVHGQPSLKKVRRGDIILMDFGGKVNGFCSDISRTICLGKPSKEQKDMYNLLYTAMNAACSEARPSMKGHLLDRVARHMIEKAGFGDYFKHSLGHGLGLVCHEHPIITFRMQDQVIPEDVVLALEPGIYLPEQYGMRIEDDVLIGNGKNIKLTNAPDTLLAV